MYIVAPSERCRGGARCRGRRRRVVRGDGGSAHGCIRAPVAASPVRIMLASLSSWLHADDEPATTNEATSPGTAASPASAASVSTSASAPPPIDALLGRSVGGLGGQKLRFRPQLFWQEVLPEHAASSCLQFHMDWSSGRNFARQPGDAEVPSNGGYARSVARAVEGTVPEAEARLVGRALREAVRVAAVRVAAVRTVQLRQCGYTLTMLTMEAGAAGRRRRGGAAPPQLVLLPPGRGRAGAL